MRGRSLFLSRLPVAPGPAPAALHLCLRQLLCDRASATPPAPRPPSPPRSRRAGRVGHAQQGLPAPRAGDQAHRGGAVGGGAAAVGGRGGGGARAAGGRRGRAVDVFV